MFVVLAVMMLVYAPLQRRVLEMATMRPRRFIAPSALVWLLLAAAYFLIPLIATFIFSMRGNVTGKCCTLGNYGLIIHDPAFWKNIKVSFILRWRRSRSHCCSWCRRCTGSTSRCRV